MKIQDPVKVVGYMRVSGYGQIDGDGFHRQKEIIEEFCRAYIPNALLTYAREEGVSGTCDADERPMLASMIEAWDKGLSEKPYAVIVEKMDRFARDLMVQECAIRDFQKLGIKVFACDHGLVDMTDDVTDPTRVLVRQMFGAIAQYDKTVTVLRLRLARKRRKALKGKCEGRKFFGEVNLNDRKIVHKILSMFDCGLRSKFIARVLKQDGVISSRGAPVSDRLVRRIISRHRTLDPNPTRKG